MSAPAHRKATLAAFFEWFAPVFTIALAPACGFQQEIPHVDDDGLVLTSGTGSESSGGGSSSGGDACPDACEVEGAALCVDGGVVVCAAGQDGCLRWGDPTACPDGQVCSEGACAAGLGFTRLADAWALPVGGRADAGFWNGDGDPVAVGDEVWRLIDLDGDGARDLVITAAAYKVGDGWETRAPGYPQASFWEVHFGGGPGGFSEPTAWPLPQDVGLLGRGLVDIANTPAHLQDHAWALRDLDGDGRLDLVVTGIGGFGEGEVLPIGTDQEPRWDVYFNTGAGFDALASKWVLPLTPDAPNFTAVDGSVVGIDGLAWSALDLDADGWTDLAVTARAPKTVFRAPGFPDSPHWEVHRGGPTGFATKLTPWTLPPGGAEDAGFLAPSGGGEADGDELWALLDLDGDGVRELVVTGAQAVAADGAAAFTDGGAHWRVHRVREYGFELSHETFAVPGDGGGDLGRGYYATTGGREAAGSLGAPYDATGWELLDIDGDGRLDLVVTNEARPSGAVYSRQVLGGAAGDADPYWLVHRGGVRGFREPERWPTPRGGLAGRGILWSAGQASPVPQVEGASMWQLVDLDGDGRLEVVVTGLAEPTGEGVVWDWRAPGLAEGAPHWQVHWQPVSRTQ